MGHPLSVLSWNALNVFGLQATTCFWHMRKPSESTERSLSTGEVSPFWSWPVLTHNGSARIAQICTELKMRSGLCEAGRQGTCQSVDHFSLATLMEIVDHAVHRNVHDCRSSPFLNGLLQKSRTTVWKKCCWRVVVSSRPNFSRWVFR